MNCTPKRCPLWTPITLALLLPLCAQAGQLSLYPMESRATAGLGKMPVLTVSTQGEDKTYVKTEVREVLFANTPQQKEVVLSGASDNDLIASPSRFILAPGSSRKIRLVYMNTVEKERDFRVYASPVVDQAEQAALEDALNGKRPGSGQKASTQGDLAISISWAGLVRMLPEHPQVRYQAALRDGQFYLKNSGNVRFRVSNLTGCGASKLCPGLDARGNSDAFNVYPDMEKTLGDGQSAQQLEFDVSDGLGGKPVHVKARELLADGGAAAK
jgi:hypothetical protein